MAVGEIDEAPTSYVRVKAQSGPLENDGTEQTEDVRYDGAKNSLMMARDYRLQYRCSFYVSQSRTLPLVQIYRNTAL